MALVSVLEDFRDICERTGSSHYDYAERIVNHPSVIKYDIVYTSDDWAPSFADCRVIVTLFPIWNNGIQFRVYIQGADDGVYFADFVEYRDAEECFNLMIGIDDEHEYTSDMDLTQARCKSILDKFEDVYTQR
jgi:hypothetical protein